jgi:tripartite-type tricarboxylate transporter receptor subunit TctC
MTFNLTFFKALLVVFATAGTLAHANDDFPSRPIDVIVPYSAGGGVSNMARAFATEAFKVMGQQWVVLNRDGGAGAIGFSALAKAKPDGYTIAFSPASPMTNVPFINANMPFRNDQVEPVCQIFENVFAIAVRPESPFRTLQDVLNRAKAARLVRARRSGQRWSPLHSLDRADGQGSLQCHCLPRGRTGPR